MAKFKVKDGTHMEGGKTYSKGDVVKSDHDLVKLFPEKFERVTAVSDDEPKAIRDHRNFDDPEASAAPPEEKEETTLPHAKTAAAKPTKKAKKPFNFDE